MHSESTSKGKYSDQKNIKDRNQNQNSIPKKPNLQQTEKINQLSNINYNIQNINNKIVTPANNGFRNFDSSKNFSSKNTNGKKFVFNEKENVNKFEGMYRQLNNQASNNNLINNNKQDIKDIDNKIPNEID